MLTSIRSTMLILAGLILGIGCTIASDFDKQIEQEFKVGKGGTLRLESDLGSVNVRSHSSDVVRITVTMIANTGSRGSAEDWFDEFEIKFDQSGNDVEVLGEWRDSWGRNNRLRISYDIVVPTEYNLDISTAGGSISVDDLEGEVALKTSGGSIKVGEIAGNVNAKTSGGSITVERTRGEATVNTSGGSINLGEIDGPVEARTSGGGIRADRVDGDVIAHTSGGSINLKFVTGIVDAKTSGGSIHAELQKPVSKPMELRTSGGGITLTVPSDFKADLDASTSGGRVKTDLPVTMKGTVSKTSLQGKLNGGGPKVVLRTSGGNIEIHENRGI